MSSTQQITVKDAAIICLGFIGALAVTGIGSSVIYGSGDAVELAAASSANAQRALAVPASGSAVRGATKRATKPVTRRAGTPRKAFMRDICNDTERMPEEPVEYDIMGRPGSSEKEWDPAVCHWTEMWHPAVPMKPLPICTHDPTVDTVISTFLHTYHFWGTPDDYLILLATGPCTSERPYMLDIGSNLGIYTILGVSRGCRAVAFEPLSQNILRVRESLKKSGWDDRAMLYKHAVGKYHTQVRIGFRPSNPGASAINAGGEVVEAMEQITIDGLLLGKTPPKFKDASGKEMPPFIGKHINFAKIDTEGYDVAVVDGALQTFIMGRVPHILVEFSPSDAQGTAGCNPWNFMRLMYANGYRMYEFSRAYPLKPLLAEELPNALIGKGRRVFEAWLIADEAAVPLMKMGLLQPFSAVSAPE